MAQETDGGSIEQFDDLRWTATRFSDVLKMDRRIIAQALETVPKAGAKQNKPVWHVRDAMPAIFMPPDVSTDPAKMTPKERRDHFEALNLQLKYERDRGLLCTQAEFQDVLAAAFKEIAQVMDTMGDVLEREFNLPPPVIEAIQAAMDKLRASMANRVRTLNVELQRTG